MKTNLYIPKKIKVGFQERSDTFTGKLAYVIYFDDKNVLRKEKSWQSWRDDKIEPIEFDNSPQSGFTMNKGFTRYSDWGSGRAVIRIWDPRDFEFEIGLDNLVGILMHSDVSKREMQEQCVFAWNGTELVLLPVNTDEYRESVKFTEKQAQKFSAKALVPGHTYIPKKSDTPQIYLGRYDCYTQKTEYADSRYGYTQSVSQVLTAKKHWFIPVDSEIAETKDPSSFISHVHMAEVHDQYAEKLEQLHKTARVQRIVGVERVSIQDMPIDELVVGRYYSNFRSKTLYYPVGDNLYIQLHVTQAHSDRVSKLSNAIVEVDRLVKIDDDGTIHYDYEVRNEYYYSYLNRNHTVKRDSTFGKTLVDYESTIQNLKSRSRPVTYIDYYNYDEEKKKQVAEEIYQFILDCMGDCVHLKWKLNNGETTKGLEYDYY